MLHPLVYFIAAGAMAVCVVVNIHNMRALPLMGLTLALFCAAVATWNAWCGLAAMGLVSR